MKNKVGNLSWVSSLDLIRGALMLQRQTATYAYQYVQQKVYMFFKCGDFLIKSEDDMLGILLTRFTQTKRC
jgi:hypothetical protein